MNITANEKVRSTIFLLLLIALGLAVGVAAASAPGYTAVAVVALFVIVAMILRPELVTPLVIFAMYANLPVIARSHMGLPGIITILVPASLALPLYYHMVIRREKLVLPPSFLWVGLFFVSVLISTLLSRNMALAMDGLTTYLTEGLMLYVLITNVVRSLTDLRWSVYALAAVAILVGGVPLFQQVTGTFDNDYGGLAQVSEATFRTGETSLQGDVRQARLAGMVGEINRYAQVMLMLVPVGMMLFFGEKNKFLRVFGAVAGLMAAAGMVLAFSRGAAVAFVLMMALMVVFRVINGKQIIGFVLVTGLVLLMIPEYSQRLVSITSVTSIVTGESTGGEDAPDGAVRGRLTEMLAAARVYGDYPLFGVGPAMFKYYSRQYSLDIALRNLMGNREAHTLYLGMAAELGTVGLTLFLLAVFVTTRELLRARKRCAALRPDLQYLPTMMFLILVAYLTTAIFLHFSYQRYFWIVFSLASAAGVIIHRELDLIEFPFLRRDPRIEDDAHANL